MSILDVQLGQANPKTICNLLARKAPFEIDLAMGPVMTYPSKYLRKVITNKG